MADKTWTREHDKKLVERYWGREVTKQRIGAHYFHGLGTGMLDFVTQTVIGEAWSAARIPDFEQNRDAVEAMADKWLLLKPGPRKSRVEADSRTGMFCATLFVFGVGDAKQTFQGRGESRAGAMAWALWRFASG